jgi:hypothetical protein
MPLRELCLFVVILMCDRITSLQDINPLIFCIFLLWFLAVTVQGSFRLRNSFLRPFAVPIMKTCDALNWIKFSIKY